MRGVIGWLGLVALGCTANPPPVSEQAGSEEPRGFEAPIVTNAASPVAYPVDLYEQGIEGTVILRLYADEGGTILPESTRVAEGSGYPPLDSAAVAGVTAMRFAPARRDGTPVATSFLQPVHFRRPDRTTPGDRP